MYILAASVLWGISDTLIDQLILVDTDGLSGRIGSEKLPSGKSKMPMQQRFLIIAQLMIHVNGGFHKCHVPQGFHIQMLKEKHVFSTFRKQRLTVCQFYICHSISSTPSETQQPFHIDLRDKKHKDQIQKAWTWVQSPGLFLEMRSKIFLVSKSLRCCFAGLCKRAWPSILDIERNLAFTQFEA